MFFMNKAPIAFLSLIVVALGVAHVVAFDVIGDCYVGTDCTGPVNIKAVGQRLPTEVDCGSMDRIRAAAISATSCDKPTWRTPSGGCNVGPIKCVRPSQ